MLSILMTKQGAIGAAIVVALMLGAAWLNGEINAAEARGEARLMAEAAEAEFDSLLANVNGAWAAEKAAADARILALSAELEAQGSQARAASSRASYAISEVRSRLVTLHDSLESLTVEDVAAIAAGIDTLEAAEAACQSALGTCEALAETERSRIYELEAHQAEALAVARQLNVTVDRLKNLRGPRMKAAGYVGWIAAIAATVLLVAR